MILFSQRRELAKEFEKWCRENGVLNNAEGVIAWLYIKDLLDKDKVITFLNKDK